MIVYDLCCGTGGWADGFASAGWEVIGVDIHPHPDFKHTFRMRDVRTLTAKDLRGASAIVASPPCEEFSRHDMPWTRAKNPPPPDTSIWEACVRLARELNIPIVLENVRGAQRFMGKAKARWGSRYLWGDVPLMLPAVVDVTKEKFSSKDYFKRAHIPIVLAECVAEALKAGVLCA